MDQASLEMLLDLLGRTRPICFSPKANEAAKLLMSEIRDLLEQIEDAELGEAE